MTLPQTIKNEDMSADNEVYEYLPPSLLPKDFDYGDEKPVSYLSRTKQKFKENPFIPIGLTLTVAALCKGIWTMKSGNHKQGQLMMRYRVLFQGLTVVALVGGAGYENYKNGLYSFSVKKE